MDDEKIDKSVSSWDKMVHAPFRKVIAYDLLCMGIGVIIGIGIGAFFIKEMVGI